MKQKVVIAGHICVDITPVFPIQGERKISQILVPGKLINMDGVSISTGGSVANTGLAMKLLGNDVKLMGKIGSDKFGTIILEALKEQGYDGTTDMIISEKDGTSYSVVLAIPGVDRIFLHSPGANNTFCYEDLDFNVISEAALFHFGYPPLMKQMYCDGGKMLTDILQRVKSYGVATSLDMAAVDPASEAGKADWRGILEQVLPYVDFFVPSVEELCYMLDRERYEAWMERACGNDITEILDIEKDVVPLARELVELGAGVVMIKCGAPGLYYRTANKQRLMQVGERLELSADAWADHFGFEKSYVPDRVLSGTGAGDTSIAAFLSAILRRQPLEMCMHMAAAAGAACVAAYDALSGLKSYEELEKRILGGWKKC